jgi:hypothetical protein
MIIRRIAASTVVALAIILASCSLFQQKAGVPGSGSAPEIIARDGIVGAHAALVSLETKHTECGTLGALNPATGAQTWDSKHMTAPVCAIIDKGIGATNLAIDATETYCSSPTFDAQNLKCSPPAAGTPLAQQLLGKLQAAVGNMNQIMADVKTATGATPAPSTTP